MDATAEAGEHLGGRLSTTGLQRQPCKACDVPLQTETHQQPPAMVEEMYRLQAGAQVQFRPLRLQGRLQLVRLALQQAASETGQVGEHAREGLQTGGFIGEELLQQLGLALAGSDSLRFEFVRQPLVLLPGEGARHEGQNQGGQEDDLPA